MGVAKAALEASVRYLANDLGPHGVRVNAISAGPIKTLASSAIGGISNMIKLHAERAPLRKAVDIDEVGDAALFLVSPLSRGISGEVIYVDGGYHILGVLARFAVLSDVDTHVERNDRSAGPACLRIAPMVDDRNFLNAAHGAMRRAGLRGQILALDVGECVFLERNTRDSRAAANSSGPDRLRKCTSSGRRRGIANRWVFPAPGFPETSKSGCNSACRTDLISRYTRSSRRFNGFHRTRCRRG